MKTLAGYNDFGDPEWKSRNNTLSGGSSPGS